MEEVLEKDWLSLDYDFRSNMIRRKPNHVLRVVHLDGWVVEDMSEWEVDGRDGIAADIEGASVSTFTEQDAHVDELTVGEEFGAFLVIIDGPQAWVVRVQAYDSEAIVDGSKWRRHDERGYWKGRLTRDGAGW